jgi:transcriptional regulator CtsR
MGMSDSIAGFILQELAVSHGCAELQRSQLAQRFGCVPSQINYVIATRFSPEHGYLVESRRGGGGYIRITRIQSSPRQLLLHMIRAVGEELELPTARAMLSNALSAGAVTESEARLLLSALGDASLHPAPPELRGRLRASIFKQMLLNLG